MAYEEIIQRSLNYIEANLQAEFSADELARQAGFSLYHYYRVFQSATGFPLKRYILRRRLCHAIYAIRCGSAGIDVALRYGFDTYAGFYRAFLREFGCTPSTYLAAGRAKRPYRPDLTKEELMTVTKQKAAALLHHWGLQDTAVADVYYESSGNRSEHSYYVGADYVLHFTSDYARLQKQLALSRALGDAGILVAAPVVASDGRDYIEADALYVWLTRRLPGTQLTAAACYESDALCRNVGMHIGLLHQALSRVDAPVDEANLLQSLVSWALPRAQEILQLPEVFCKAYLARFTELHPTLPFQIIHRDPNPGNIRCDGERMGFVEFELSERNLRIYDPCYAATAILSESFQGQAQAQWLDVYHAIFRGYDETARLSNAEREAVPYVLLANQMICVAYFSQFEKYAEIFETNKHMTRWLMERWEELKL